MGNQFSITFFNGDGSYTRWKPDFCDRLCNLSDAVIFAELKGSKISHPDFFSIELAPDRTKKAKRGMLLLLKKTTFGTTDKPSTNQVVKRRCPVGEYCRHAVEYISFVLTIKGKKYHIISVYHTAERRINVTKACCDGLEKLLIMQQWEHDCDFSIFLGDVNLSGQFTHLTKRMEAQRYYHHGAVFDTNFFSARNEVPDAQGNPQRKSSQTDVIFVWSKLRTVNRNNQHPRNEKFHAALIFEIGDLSYADVVCDDTCNPSKADCPLVHSLSNALASQKLHITSPSRRRS